MSIILRVHQRKNFRRANRVEFNHLDIQIRVPLRDQKF